MQGINGIGRTGGRAIGLYVGSSDHRGIWLAGTWVLWAMC